MNWTEAYAEMKKGNKVRMSSWLDKNEFIHLINDHFYLAHNDYYEGQTKSEIRMPPIYLDAPNWEVFIEKEIITTFDHLIDAVVEFGCKLSLTVDEKGRINYSLTSKGYEINKFNEKYDLILPLF